MNDKISCACLETNIGNSQQIVLRKKIIILSLTLMAWWIFYHQLLTVSGWLTYDLFGLERGTHLGEALSFFLYDVPKVLMLLVLVVFGVGILRSFFTPEKTRAILSGKKESVGNVMAAGLGIATPFCTKGLETQADRCLYRCRGWGNSCDGLSL
ncbi:MAG: permease [Deltaproteobacteria bacterium]|nr:permease [Deltaproteobacteria bacterium]